MHNTTIRHCDTSYSVYGIQRLDECAPPFALIFRVLCCWSTSHCCTASKTILVDAIRDFLYLGAEVFDARWVSTIWRVEITSFAAT
ncbi:hypothetical protein SERLADRAFT_391197 [Serpula lacrymans var. lacrymans S7.9]|uniref:Uncharacterized protein n=1 Tax=Serpula lacrymans var. lacrymans (strain S7.9) TaxID=578457 RepID=F8NZL7_SERL9|nr:uncharacterized protein SERLADRAFT_391197 [Serpula lacrymans var. lacrymans S7.9]EGO23348.1 hypothetical protein SERLADRAFT_391197 [Serpula lacrymans var. lacrymans S7.9]